MMVVENFILPDLLESMRISTSSSQENTRNFLTDYSIVYAVSGTLCLKNSDSEQIIEEGELALIPPGTYAFSESANDQNHSGFTFFFDQWTAQCILKLPEVISALSLYQPPVSRQKVYIIPRQKVFRNFFNAVQLYHNLEKKLKKEMLPVKFTELIYLLLNSPHRDVVLSFLSEATGNMTEKR